MSFSRCPDSISIQSIPVTGNRCKHKGYDEFAEQLKEMEDNGQSTWNSECAPDTDKWIDLDMGICGEANSYPEEFWACSDISLTSGETQIIYVFPRVCMYTEVDVTTARAVLLYAVVGWIGSAQR